MLVRREFLRICFSKSSVAWTKQTSGDIRTGRAELAVPALAVLLVPIPDKEISQLPSKVEESIHNMDVTAI